MIKCTIPGIIRGVLFCIFFAVLHGCQWPSPQSDTIVNLPSDGRIVHIVHNDQRGRFTACVEPSLKSKDQYLERVETLVSATTSFHNLEKGPLERERPADASHQEKTFSTQGAARLTHESGQRVHNMRELLFELCQAYQNGLIDHSSYERIFVRIVDRTTALHAMEILMFELDQKPYDDDTRDRLIELTKKIFVSPTPIQLDHLEKVGSSN